MGSGVPRAKQAYLRIWSMAIPTVKFVNFTELPSMALAKQSYVKSYWPSVLFWWSVLSSTFQNPGLLIPRLLWHRNGTPLLDFVKTMACFLDLQSELQKQQMASESGYLKSYWLVLVLRLASKAKLIMFLIIVSCRWQLGLHYRDYSCLSLYLRSNLALICHSYILIL